METSTIDRRNSLKCLALAIGAAIVPECVIVKLGNPKNNEGSFINPIKPIHIKSGEGETACERANLQAALNNEPQPCYTNPKNPPLVE